MGIIGQHQYFRRWSLADRDSSLQVGSRVTLWWMLYVVCQHSVRSTLHKLLRSFQYCCYCTVNIIQCFTDIWIAGMYRDRYGFLRNSALVGLDLIHVSSVFTCSWVESTSHMIIVHYTGEIDTNKPSNYPSGYSCIPRVVVKKIICPAQGTRE
jgi:hypothetical protein